MNKKIIVLLIVAALISAFFIFDLQQYLNFEYLKSAQADLAELKADKPLLLAGGFFIIYVLGAALSVPGASIMTLAGGAIFGTLLGTVLVSFASTIGATLAFLVSRYLLRDTVQSKFGDRLASINDGFEKDGMFYLATLRLIPVIPFVAINLLMGLTPIRLFTYYLVSQIAMIPATLIYVNAGSQLATIESPGDILSLSLFLSFLLLATFPIIAKFVVDSISKRKNNDK